MDIKILASIESAVLFLIIGSPFVYTLFIKIANFANHII